MTQSQQHQKQLKAGLLEQSYALVDPVHHPMEREQFSSYFNYILAVVGFAAGYGSFWRFPSLVYQHGGGAFLVPYTIIMVVLGFPLIYLETIIGQMFQTTIPKMFQKVNTGYKMFGYFIIFLPLGISTYYNILLAYSYRYVFVSFMNPLPFESEAPTSNQYFRNNILHRSDSIDDFGTVHWELAILFIVSLFVCYEIIKNGLEVTGKVLLITVIAPYIFLLILIVRAIPLSGSYQGLVYLFKPDFSKIFTGKIWVDATAQVFFQVSIGASGLVNFASLKKKSQKFMSIIWLIPVSVILCGLMCGVAIFMFVGHFCYEHNIDIKSLTLSGQQLAFSVVPKAISLLPWSNLFLFIFSFILIMLGIDTQFAFFQTIVGTVQEDIKTTKNGLFGYRPTNKQLYIALISFVALFFPLFCSSAGIYYLGFFDAFVTDINLPLGALFELYVFVYIFNFESLEEEVQKYVGCKTPSIIRWALKSKLLIGMLVVIIMLGLIDQISLYSKYSTGMYLLGWFITLYPLAFAIIYWKLYATDYNRTTFAEIEQYEKNKKNPPIELM